MSTNQDPKGGSQAPKYSEPTYAKSSGNKPNTDFPWYNPSIDKYLVPETQRLLEEYSKIPREQQSKHVHEIRDRAWAIRTYPCTGNGVWLLPYISRSPEYSNIIQRLKDGAIFLDIGCFVGGDFRQLVFDGAPSDRMYGVDVVSHWEVGFDMFQDRDSFKGTFVEADLMKVDASNKVLDSLKGKADIISISAVLHQWDWDAQLEAAKKLILFSKPGSMVVGHQIGNLKGQAYVHPAMGLKTYQQNPESFAELWNAAGKETNTEWDTKARLSTFKEFRFDPEDSKWLPEDTRVIDFVVNRIR